MLGDKGDLEEAWKAFTLMEATGWRFLPYPGGLMDQPEILLKNIAQISAVYQAMKERKREEKANG